MIDSLRRTLRRLRKHESGNALLLMALGLPTFIGGGGLAVDTAQWYMWKREMQYAVDQAALAGAWARTEESTEGDYATRAAQEYRDNVAAVEGFDATPNIRLSSYDGGTENSVTVSASATKMLPFTGFLTGGPTTVDVMAQASFAGGQSYTSCMVAVDDDADGAITINGNVSINAACGMAALSISDTSIIKNGEGAGDIEVGYLLSRGEIDDYFDTNGNNEVHENLDNLSDPFEGLSPPNVTNAQTYVCPKGRKTSEASYAYNEATTTVYKYTFRQGTKANSTLLSSPTKGDTTGSPTGPTAKTSTTAVTEGVHGPTAGTAIWAKISGNGSNTIWEVQTPWVTTTITDLVFTEAGYEGDGVASVASGVYSSIRVQCNTVFTGGVYVIDGGSLDLTGNYQVTGDGVMFVLKNGADIKITGTSTMTLTAMTSAELENYVSADQAALLAGMLIFEDRQSGGSSHNRIAGTTNLTLNGTIYLPVSGIDFSGTANVTSQCLMIAANTITISGSVDMENFCPDGMVEDTTVSTGEKSVKLVA